MTVGDTHLYLSQNLQFRILRSSPQLVQQGFENVLVHAIATFQNVALKFKETCDIPSLLRKLKVFYRLMYVFSTLVINLGVSLNRSYFYFKCIYPHTFPIILHSRYSTIRCYFTDLCKYLCPTYLLFICLLSVTFFVETLVFSLLAISDYVCSKQKVNTEQWRSRNVTFHDVLISLQLS